MKRLFWLSYFFLLPSALASSFGSIEVTNPTVSPVPIVNVSPSPYPSRVFVNNTQASPVPVTAPSASPVYVNVINQPVPSPTITIVEPSPTPMLDESATATLSSGSPSVSMSVHGVSEASVTIGAGFTGGTIAGQASSNGSALVSLSNSQGGNWSSNPIPANSPGVYKITGLAGFDTFTATGSSLVGSASVKIDASTGVSTISVKQTNGGNLHTTFDGAIPGASSSPMPIAAPSTAPVFVTVTNPAPSPSPSITVVGNVGVIPNSLSTYSGCYTGLAVPATPTDIFYITGSSTKTVTVLKLQISGNETTVAQRLFSFITRSTADSGGACATATIGPFDQNNAAATATVQGCTTSPTSLGTVSALVGAEVFVIPATTGVDSSWPQIRTFGGAGQGQGVVLRGTSQSLAVNTLAAIAGSSLNLCVTWTEQ